MRNGTSTRILLAAGVLIHILSGRAAAQPAPAAEAEPIGPGPAGEGRPWAEGVSEARQQRALMLYREGTRALKDMQFATAVARYREALGHWDHPGIHYHLAIALINLEQPVEAYRSVRAALRHDGAALHSHERIQALHYKTLLQQRVATLELRCAGPGASVLLDGRRLLACPDQGEHLLLAGEHHLVVRKPGHLTLTDALVLQPGTRTALAIHERHEMLARWIPWAMVGGGVATGGLGGVLHWRAGVDMARFDATFPVDCADGCHDDSERSPAWLMERARWEQRAAIAAYTAGAGLVLAGLVLAWVNPQRSFRVDERRISGEPLVMPVLSPGGAGIVMDTRF